MPVNASANVASDKLERALSNDRVLLVGEGSVWGGFTIICCFLAGESDGGDPKFGAGDGLGFGTGTRPACAKNRPELVIFKVRELCISCNVGSSLCFILVRLGHMLWARCRWNFPIARKNRLKFALRLPVNAFLLS